MKLRRTLQQALITSLAVIAAACSPSGESYRFRMTVEVETPEGVRTGSGVFAVWAGRTSEFLPEAAKRDWTLKGEAVPVDLPGGGTLFALMKTDNPMLGDLALVSMATLDPAFKNDIPESAGRISSKKGVLKAADVAPSNYPVLVRFRDINNPASVEKVDPTDLAASFVPNIRLRRIQIEITDEDVSEGIEKRLPWLESYDANDRRLSGNNSVAITTNNFADNLGTGAFRQGE